MAASENLSSPRVAPRSVIRVAATSAITLSIVSASDLTAAVQDASPTVRYRTCSTNGSSPERSVVDRDGMLYAVHQHLPARAGETPFTAKVRYRTVGDASCTAAVASDADTVEKVIEEVAATRITERGATRGDDRISEAAMEDRKKEGYF